MRLKRILCTKMNGTMIKNRVLKGTAQKLNYSIDYTESPFLRFIYASLITAITFLDYFFSANRLVKSYNPIFLENLLYIILLNRLAIQMEDHAFFSS